jgi:carboxymethylenebutenolidase
MKDMRSRESRLNRGPFAGCIGAWSPFLAVGAGLLLACLFAVVTSALAPSLAQGAQAASGNTEAVHYDSGGFNIDAYLAKPSGSGKHPAVIVIHDNSGLNDSIRDISNQFADAGFIALAPDLTSRLGGTRGPEQMAQAVGQLSPNMTVQDLRSAFAYLQKDSEVDAAKISVVGFGWGGWRSFMLAVTVPDLYRAVVYSGSTPTQSFDAVRAPVLAHYAQFDFRVTGNALWTEKTMTEAGKKFTYYVYPQVYRAFYASGPQYNAEAAKLAWTRTLDFLQR